MEKKLSNTKVHSGISEEIPREIKLKEFVKKILGIKLTKFQEEILREENLKFYPIRRRRK